MYLCSRRNNFVYVDDMIMFDDTIQEDAEINLHLILCYMVGLCSYISGRICILADGVIIALKEGSGAYEMNTSLHR